MVHETLFDKGYWRKCVFVKRDTDAPPRLLELCNKARVIESNLENFLVGAELILNYRAGFAYLELRAISEAEIASENDPVAGLAGYRPDPSEHFERNIHGFLLNKALIASRYVEASYCCPFTDGFR